MTLHDLSPPVHPRVEKRPLPAASKLWEMVAPQDFIDGYCVESPLPARTAADIGLSLPPWAGHLLTLRNHLVRPLGLKTEVSATGDGAIFPVTYEDSEEVILGTDDRHLNFRICVRQEAGRVYMATWVHRNNALGHAYLATVMPFHILIVRDSMRRIARASTAPT